MGPREQRGSGAARSGGGCPHPACPSCRAAGTVRTEAACKHASLQPVPSQTLCSPFKENKDGKDKRSHRNGLFFTFSSTNKTGSRPPAARRGRVLALPSCCQPCRFSVQPLTRLLGLDRDATSGRSPTGRCASVLLQLLLLAVTTRLPVVPGAFTNDALLSIPSRGPAPPAPATGAFQTYPEHLRVVQPRHQHQAFGSEELRGLYGRRWLLFLLLPLTIPGVALRLGRHTPATSRG